MCKQGVPIQTIAYNLGRTVYAIQCKIEQMPPESIRPNIEPKLNTEEKKMSTKTNHIISLLQTGYTTISCVFPDSNGNYLEGRKLYTYKTVETGLKKDDLVLVKVTTEFKVCKVVEVHTTPQIDIDSNINYTWIVQKVDTATYESLLKKEEEFAESLQAIEKEKRKAQMVADFKEFMPKEAQPLLNQAIENLTGESLPAIKGD